MGTLDEDLSDYQEVYERPTPIKYDVLRLSDEHRKFDGLIRRYWDDLHPLMRDLFTSFANEFQYLISLAEEVEKKKDAEIASLKTETIKQLESLTQMLEKLKIEYEGIITDNQEEMANQKSENEKIQANLESLTSQLQELQSQYTMQDKLISQQKEQIENLNTEASKKASVATTEIINESIANVDAFSKQLEMLEQEMLMLESQKNAAEKKVEFLEQRIKEQQTSFDERNTARTQKVEDLKSNVRELYKRAEKNALEMKSLRQEANERSDLVYELEKKNNFLEKENLKVKEFLEKQIAINKNYHSLTLKVIELSKKDEEKPQDRQITLTKQLVENDPRDSPLPSTLERKRKVKILEDTPEVNKPTDNDINVPIPGSKTKEDEVVDKLVSSLLRKIDDSEKGIFAAMKDFPKVPTRESEEKSKEKKDDPIPG